MPMNVSGYGWVCASGPSPLAAWMTKPDAGEPTSPPSQLPVVPPPSQRQMGTASVVILAPCYTLACDTLVPGTGVSAGDEGALAQVGPGHRGVGAVDLARQTVGVEDRVGDQPRAHSH